MWAKDLSRTIDYLETREDIDAGRAACWASRLAARETVKSRD
jgi:hypothetical protein